MTRGLEISVDTGLQCAAYAGIAQLVERNLAKVEVASSSLVSRSSWLHANVARRLLSRAPFQDWPAAPPGGVAEWSCSGLQSRVRRFDSDPRLQHLRKGTP